MKVVECNLEPLKGIFRDNVVACDVTKFEECRKCLDNLGGDESLDYIHINLLFVMG